jgi:hypothetical protein
LPLTIPLDNRTAQVYSLVMLKTNIESRIAKVARRIARLQAAERARYGAHVAARLRELALAEVERMRKQAA